MPYKNSHKSEETDMKSRSAKEISGDKSMVGNDGLYWCCKDKPLKADLPTNSIQGRKLFVWH